MYGKLCRCRISLAGDPGKYYGGGFHGLFSGFIPGITFPCKNFFLSILVRQEGTNPSTRGEESGWTTPINPIELLIQEQRRTKRKSKRMESPQRRGGIPVHLLWQAADELRKLLDGLQRSLFAFHLPEIEC